MVGSPTGRIEETDIFKMWQQMRHYETPPSYVREAMSVLGESVENALAGLDFSGLEDRTVAILCGVGIDGVVTYKRVGLSDPIQGHRGTMCIIDELEPTTSDGSDIHECMLKLFENETFNIKLNRPLDFIDKASMMPLPLPIKPMKQNGRSASYLDLDPTKKHINRRRKKR